MNIWFALAIIIVLIIAGMLLLTPVGGLRTQSIAVCEITDWTGEVRIYEFRTQYNGRVTIWDLTEEWGDRS